jgi:AAA domain
MTNTISVRKAKREKLIAAIQIAGPSGAGKTLGGLLMAYGMMKELYPDLSEEKLWDKIALVDTEHERSLVYEGLNDHRTYGVKIGEFLFVPLDKPYNVSRYNQAVKAAKDAGAEVVVIDSISHAWEAEGGLLDLQQQKGGNFQAWREINPVYGQFVDLAIGVTHRIHTISTARAKQEYAMEQSETGKLSVKKLGLKQVQRDSLEYEFQIVFNVDMDHVASTSKDNSGLFERPDKITPDHGRKLIQWLDKGIDVKGKEEEDRLNFLDMIEQATEHYGKPVVEKVKEIEGKMKKPLVDLPYNLVQLAWTRINELISQIEAEKKAVPVQ